MDNWSVAQLGIFITVLSICIDADDVTVQTIQDWRTDECSNPAVSFQSSTTPEFLYSPRDPGSGYRYPNNTACSWLITSPIETARIHLTVVQREIACCCHQDYLLIKDGSNSEARLIAMLCFNYSPVNPVTIISSGTSLYGEFRTDGDGYTGAGYTLQYEHYDSKDITSCPAGWIRRDYYDSYQNHYCYKLYDDRLSWQQAASRCGYDGGFLASIFHPEENKFLVDSFVNETSLVWIGLDSYGYWLDGSGPATAMFSNFRYKSEATSARLCGHAAIDFADNGLWRVTGCENEYLPFICKKRKDGSDGRYWTDVNTGDVNTGDLNTGDTSVSLVNMYIVCIPVVIFSIIFLVVVCCRGKKREDWLCVISMRVTCGAMCLCWRLFRENCCPCHYHEEPADQHGGDLDDMAPFGSPYSTRRGMSRVFENSRPPPPAYLEMSTLSSAPPPAYTGALDPTFDFPTAGNRGSHNSSSVIPAPSYDSVTRSDAIPSSQSVGATRLEENTDALLHVSTDEDVNRL